jgi:hypothetical protein
MQTTSPDNVLSFETGERKLRPAGWWTAARDRRSRHDILLRDQANRMKGERLAETLLA